VRYHLKYPLKYISYLAIYPLWRKKVRSYLYDAFLYTKAEKEEIIRKKQQRLNSQKLWDDVLSIIDEGTICIDCGANIGKVSAAWAAKGAIIHAFEPHPACFKALESNLQGQPNIYLYNEGVGCKNEILNLYLKNNTSADDINESASIISDKLNVSSENFVQIPIIDLNEFINNLRVCVDVLKLDIEGAEVELLNEMIDRGMHKKIGLIVAELHEEIPGLRCGILSLKEKIKAQSIENIHLDWE